MSKTKASNTDSATSWQLSILGKFRNGLQEDVGVEIEAIRVTEENVVELEYSICDLHDHEAIVEEIRQIAGWYIPYQEAGGFTGLEATVREGDQDLAQWRVEASWAAEYMAGDCGPKALLGRIEDELTPVEV